MLKKVYGTFGSGVCLSMFGSNSDTQRQTDRDFFDWRQNRYEVELTTHKAIWVLIAVRTSEKSGVEHVGSRADGRIRLSVRMTGIWGKTPKPQRIEAALMEGSGAKPMKSGHFCIRNSQFGLQFCTWTFFLIYERSRLASGYICWMVMRHPIFPAWKSHNY